jgi:predicted nucleic acid-binding protein
VTEQITGLTLDTGALIALQRGDERVRLLLRQAELHRWPVAVPAGVVAQAWRGGPRQARVARLLNDPAVETVSLDGLTARAVGVLAGRCGHSDVVDVSVALCAGERGHTVVTSDPDDLTTVDAKLPLIRI